MQTWITDMNVYKNAKNLSFEHIRAQRYEGNEIAFQLFDIPYLMTNPRKKRKHPAIEQWKGYELFYVTHYLKAIHDEWEARGYKSEICQRDFDFIYTHCVLHIRKFRIPDWYNQKTIFHHRSVLIQKNNQYSTLFPCTPKTLTMVYNGKEWKN